MIKGGIQEEDITIVNIMILQICGIQKNNTNQSIYKTKMDSQTEKPNSDYQKIVKREG